MTDATSAANPDDQTTNKKTLAISRRDALKRSAAVGVATVGATALTQALSIGVAAAADGRVEIIMTPAQASTFMRMLATDDGFRKSLQRDPRGILATNGIIIPQDMLPTRVVLPSKARIQEVIRAISSELETPTAGGLAAAFPLAFVLVLIFVFIPSNAGSRTHPSPPPAGR